MFSDENVNTPSFKVSVIVPIYNAGDRIYKCLDTLVNQTLKEIEIICVLDCPTDDTDKVVEEYAKKDSRIVVVRNEHNLHVSGSRNAGMKVARGEYVGFSDHDDYRELNMYELLYGKAKETNADIVVSDTHVIHENGAHETERLHVSNKDDAVKGAIEPWTYFPNQNRFCKCIWCNLYRRNFLDKNDLRFVGWGEIMYEDELFNSIAFVCCSALASVGTELYTWHKSIESTSNNWIHREEMVKTMTKRTLREMELLVEALSQNGVLKRYEPSIWRRISEEIHLHYPNYVSLVGDERQRLCQLMRKIHFPLFGRYNLKLFSKKRLKLLFFVLKLKWDGRKV